MRACLKGRERTDTRQVGAAVLQIGLDIVTKPTLLAECTAAPREVVADARLSRCCTLLPVLR